MSAITLRGIALQSLNYIVDNGVIILSKVYSNANVTDKTYINITKTDKGEDNINITSKNSGDIVL